MISCMHASLEKCGPALFWPRMSFRTATVITASPPHASTNTMRMIPGPERRGFFFFFGFQRMMVRRTYAESAPASFEMTPQGRSRTKWCASGAGPGGAAGLGFYSRRREFRGAAGPRKQGFDSEHERDESPFRLNPSEARSASRGTPPAIGPENKVLIASAGLGRTEWGITAETPEGGSPPKSMRRRLEAFWIDAGVIAQRTAFSFSFGVSGPNYKRGITPGWFHGAGSSKLWRWNDSSSHGDELIAYLVLFTSITCIDRRNYPSANHRREARSPR